MEVHPPLTKKEMMAMFVGTLRALDYKRLDGSVTKNFANMVISKEMIENIIKSDRISFEESSGSIKKIVTKGKKKEVNVVGENRARFNQSLHLAQPIHLSNVLNTSLNPYSPC